MLPSATGVGALGLCPPGRVTVSRVTSSLKRPLGGCLVCASGLVLVALLAFRVAPVQRLDASVLSRLTVLGGSSPGAFAGFAVDLVDPLPLLAILSLACLLAMRRGRPRRAVAALALVAGANLTTQALKVALAHPRYQSVLGYRQIGSASFPSGHATAAMSMPLAFVLVVPRAWRGGVALFGACLVAIVGCSVVVLHRHYPSDVIGGLLVAAGWFFAVLAGLRMPAAATRQPAGSARRGGGEGRSSR